MQKTIRIYEPDLSGNEQKYVTDCIASSWISGKGKYIEEFEDNFSSYIGANYSVAVCNGTVALHVALLALGIGPGDEVIVPTLTYIASVNAIAYTGAKPVFVDSVLGTWQIDPEDIKRKISSKTKAILVVHLYGLPCELSSIDKICKKNHLYLVEDCAEAIGSYYHSQHVGTYGDVSTFSFYGNKTITTGEGGMVVTNNETIEKSIRHLKGQGLAQNREYWHDIVGYNYRMTNVAAAIGVAQLERIHHFLDRKTNIYRTYKKKLSSLPITFQQETTESTNSFWMISILLKHPALREPLRKYLSENGIETRPLFYPVHSMPMYSTHDAFFPVAKDISHRGINLPSYPGLTDMDVKYISNLISKFYNRL